MRIHVAGRRPPSGSLNHFNSNPSVRSCTMPSAGGSGARNADPGGRQQSTSSRRSNNSTQAAQAEARASRHTARGSGAANAKDDGMSDAARAAQAGKPVAAAEEGTQHRKRRSLPNSSSEEDEDLEAAGVVKQSDGKEKLKKSSHQPVHAFMFDCNTCLTHHSIFFAGTRKQYPRQRRPASPEQFARARHVRNA